MGPPKGEQRCGISRVSHEGTLEVGDGFGKPPLLHQQLAEPEVAERVVRVEIEDLAEHRCAPFPVGNRRRRLILCGLGQILLVPFAPHFRAHGLGRFAFGILDPALLVVVEREIRMGHHRQWVDLEQPLHQLDGFLVAPVSTEDHTQRFVGIRIRRADRDRPFVKLDCLFLTIRRELFNRLQLDPARPCLQLRRTEERQRVDPHRQLRSIFETALDLSVLDTQFANEHRLQKVPVLPAGGRQYRAALFRYITGKIFADQLATDRITGDDLEEHWRPRCSATAHHLGHCFLAEIAPLVLRYCGIDECCLMDQDAFGHLVTPARKPREYPPRFELVSSNDRQIEITVIPGDEPPTAIDRNRETALVAVLSHTAHRFGPQSQMEPWSVNDGQRDVVGDDVIFEPSHGSGSDLGRKQDLDPVCASVQETECLEPSTSVEERGRLRLLRTQTLDVRGQLAVEEAHSIAPLRYHQGPSRQRRPGAAEKQRFRR